MLVILFVRYINDKRFGDAGFDIGIPVCYFEDYIVLKDN